jgi:pyruvate-formate lyase
MRVPNGLSCGYMLGGRDRDGSPVQNELTEMCMQVVDDIRLVYPAVGLCAFSGMDDKYLKKACEILSHGCSHPAIFNDDIISEGLRFYGVPEDESHDYIHSTCVEITPSAASNVWVASPYTNMPQLLLDELDGEHESCDALVAAILSRLDEKIKQNFEKELGKSYTVLFEQRKQDLALGHTANFIEVGVKSPCDLCGCSYTVTLTHHKDGVALGELHD